MTVCNFVLKPIYIARWFYKGFPSIRFLKKGKFITDDAFATPRPQKPVFFGCFKAFKFSIKFIKIAIEGEFWGFPVQSFLRTFRRHSPGCFMPVSHFAFWGGPSKSVEWHDNGRIKGGKPSLVDVIWGGSLQYLCFNCQLEQKKITFFIGFE